MNTRRAVRGWWRHGRRGRRGVEHDDDRVNAALRRHGIERRPDRSAPPPPLELDRTALTELYVTRRLEDSAIGARHGVPPYRVTQRRRELGVRRPAVAPPYPPPPDRRGGPPAHARTLHPATTPGALRRPGLETLLHRHQIPLRASGGTITQRFPDPTDINAAILVEAYTDTGLSAEHIEQLTGQPRNASCSCCTAPRNSGSTVRTGLPLFTDGTPPAEHHPIGTRLICAATGGRWSMAAGPTVGTSANDAGVATTDPRPAGPVSRRGRAARQLAVPARRRPRRGHRPGTASRPGTRAHDPRIGHRATGRVALAG